MSNNDFTLFDDFPQGTSAAVPFSATRETTGPRREDGPTISGLEPPKKHPIRPKSGSGETPSSDDLFTQTPHATAPALPETSTVESAPSTPVTHIAAEKTPLKLHPPAQKRAADSRNAGGTAKRPAFRLDATLGFAALSSVLGISLAVALFCLMRTPEPPSPPTVTTDIPVALLPDSADPAIWEIVSQMRGEINGARLSFERGLATDADGRTYKVQLDFCRSGDDIYAKVAGEKLHVVCLDTLGNIMKVYPSPKNNKPLKDIFAKRAPTTEK